MKNVIVRSRNITIMGDFNCKEVLWEDWLTEGGELSWGNRLLQLAMDNILPQWVTENTRFRGNEEPSRLDLVFTKEPEIIENVTYKSPIGKSDHVLIEMELKVRLDEIKRKDYTNSRFNFGKTNFKELQGYFEHVDWTDFYMSDKVEDKWKIFME